MTFREYQLAAAQTAQYPAVQAGLTYPVLGLLSEVGELAGVFAKAMRDGEPANFRKRVIAECGDILWMLAMIDHDRGIEWTGENEELLSEFSHPLAPHLRHAALVVLAQHSLELALPPTNKNARHLIITLAGLLGTVDSTLLECAEFNIAKLRDRAARGVISGSGDDR